MSSCRLACAGAVVLLGGWCFLAAGRASDDASRRPNFLVIVSDDQRPDTIAALGNPIIRTPTLDRLVEEGTTFTRAIVGQPICTPSRAEILTGCDGFRNGVPALGRGEARHPDLVLWPTAMREGGYVAWYVGKWMNDGKPISRGYDASRGLFAAGGSRWHVDGVDWHGRPITGYTGWVFQTDDRTLQPELGVGLTPEISRRFADAAVELIEQKPGKPFFLHVNFTAPHDPLLMPPGYEAMYDPSEMALPLNFLPEHPFDHGNLRGRDEQLLPWPRTEGDVRADLAVYYAVISHMDAQIGRILAALEATGQIEDTVVIYTSDHGLGMGSHGLRGKQNMYEHTIGVPLILRGPGVPRGQRRSAGCYLRDLYPTVCDMAGIPVPATVQGRSLVPVLQDETQQIYPHLFAYYRDAQRMIRTERWKLIHYPKIAKYQLFDLDNDPEELEDLAGSRRYPEVMAELRTKLHAWEKETCHDK